MSQALIMFNSVGPTAFSHLACQMAPYYGTIFPEVSKLKPGHAVVNVPFREEITNHFAHVHTIALCNAAELAGGMMTDASIPMGGKWIPKGMTVEYLSKAKSSIRAVADGSSIDWETAGDKVVRVDVFDKEGVKVFTAKITMNVKLG